MDELFALRDAMFNEFGEDIVREISDNADFPIDIVPDMLDDESVIEMFAEMVHFIVEDLAPIDIEKARKTLASANISDRDISDLLD